MVNKLKKKNKEIFSLFVSLQKSIKVQTIMLIYQRRTFYFSNKHKKLWKIHLPVSRGRKGISDAPGVEPRGSELVPGGGRGGDPRARGGSCPRVCPESPVRDRHGPNGSARGGCGCSEARAPRGGRWHGAPESEPPVPRVLPSAQPDT